MQLIELNCCVVVGDTRAIFTTLVNLESIMIRNFVDKGGKELLTNCYFHTTKDKKGCTYIVDSYEAVTQAIAAQMGNPIIYIV